MSKIDMLFAASLLCSVISLLSGAFLLGHDFAEWKASRSGALTEIVVKPTQPDR